MTSLPALIEDLVAANRILAGLGVLDGFGHVSARHPEQTDRYLLSRSLAPELVTHDDIMTFDFASTAQDNDTRQPYLEVRNRAQGAALAETLEASAVVLMRGHGFCTVGETLQVAVYRAYYTQLNAALQQQAIALGGSITFLENEEGALADKTNMSVIARPWEAWKAKYSPRSGNS